MALRRSRDEAVHRLDRDEPAEMVDRYRTIEAKTSLAKTAPLDEHERLLTAMSLRKFALATSLQLAVADFDLRPALPPLSRSASESDRLARIGSRLLLP